MTSGPHKFWNSIWIAVFGMLFPATSFAQSYGLVIEDIPFRHLTQKNGLKHKYLVSVAEDHYGFLWFAHRRGGGLTRWDGYDFKSYFVNDQDSTSLASNQVIYLYVDRANFLWIATAQGLNRYDIVNDIFHQYNRINGSSQGLSSDHTEVIVEDKEGNIWIGGSHGLNRWHPSADTFSQYFPDKTQIGGPNAINALAIDPDQSDVIWCGTHQGLFKLNTTSSKFELQNIEDLYLPNHVVHDVRFTGRDTLLLMGFGTANLIYYDPKNGHVWQVPPGKEVPQPSPFWTHSELSGLVSEKYDGVWVTSSYLPGFHSSQSSSYALFPTSSGEDARLLNQAVPNISRDRHGHLIFPGHDGISISIPSIEPRKILPGPVRCYLSSLQVNGKEYIDHIHHTHDLTLSSFENSLVGSLVLPNPVHPDSATYGYKLHPHDKEWLESTSRNFYYENLRGGSYELRVRARENYKDWTEVSNYFINIEIPFYKKWWFMLVSITFIALVWAGVLKIQTSRIRREERLKSSFAVEKMQLESKLLRSQMNPHFIFNALNSINTSILKNEAKQASKQLQQFSTLIRNILSQSSKNYITLAEELNNVALYVELEQNRFDHQFNYQVDIGSNIITTSVFVPAMLIQPHIENAIWHGILPKEDLGHVKVNIVTEANNLNITIEDDGIGRAAAKKHSKTYNTKKKSFGLQIAKTRIQLLKSLLKKDTYYHIGDVHDRKGLIAGTLVEIRIPVITKEDISK